MYTTTIISLYEAPDTYGISFSSVLASWVPRRIKNETSLRPAVVLYWHEIRYFLAVVQHTAPTDDHDQRTLAIRRPILFLFGEYYTSAVSVIPFALYGLSYGLTQTMVLRWGSEVELTPETQAMGFGQIVPLSLIILPLLTAVELFSGKQLSRLNSVKFLTMIQPVQRPRHSVQRQHRKQICRRKKN
jgi:hypothetical protein